MIWLRQNTTDLSHWRCLRISREHRVGIITPSRSFDALEIDDAPQKSLSPVAADCTDLGRSKATGDYISRHTTTIHSLRNTLYTLT